MIESSSVFSVVSVVILNPDQRVINSAEFTLLTN